MTLFVIALVGCANNDNKTRSEAQEKAETTAIEELTPAVEEQVTSEVAPDFTLNDINGKPLALSSLRGKYVILDFWGSWCVWCIRGIPNMKEYYNKYKGKFEILGIDCNDSEQEWKVFQLFLTGMAYNQMALNLGVTVKSVDNAMQRVRRKLKSVLK